MLEPTSTNLSWLLRLLRVLYHLVLHLLKTCPNDKEKRFDLNVINFLYYFAFLSQNERQLSLKLEQQRQDLLVCWCHLVIASSDVTSATSCFIMTIDDCS